VIHVPPLRSRAQGVERALVAAAAAAGDKPVLACFLDRAGGRGVLSGPSGSRGIPRFGFPEAAAAALGRAARLAEWRGRPVGGVPDLGGVDAARADRLVREFLASRPDGGWLAPELAGGVLRCFGIGVVETRAVATAAEAARAADEIGFPVALKAGAAELVHKSDVGGVRLTLGSGDAVRDAFTEMDAVLGDRMGGAIVQPMVAPGVEMIVGVVHDASFGPLVLFGSGGYAAELERDTALRLVPLTDVDAHELVRSLRTSPLLFGYRNTPIVDVGALEDLLLRIGLLAEGVPEVAELDCNPVVVSPAGAVVVDVKLRVAPHGPAVGEGLRRLRAPA
jgi:acyl-CoA synthetase (NDP forming)